MSKWRIRHIAIFLILAMAAMFVVPPGSCFGDDGKGGDGQVKRLTRDMTNAKLGGVCAGIANYFGIDVSLVRVGLVIFTLMYGAGILAYLICWVVIPPGP